MRFKDIPRYLRGLQVGERVVETAPTCMKGREGTVYYSPRGVCVEWDAAPGDLPGNRMSTGATYGTRRIVKLGEIEMIETAPGVLEQVECPNTPDLLPVILEDGRTTICPRCGGRLGASGVDGGCWVHY